MFSRKRIRKDSGVQMWGAEYASNKTLQQNLEFYKSYSIKIDDANSSFEEQEKENNLQSQYACVYSTSEQCGKINLIRCTSSK